jgi:hypothetical protein
MRRFYICTSECHLRYIIWFLSQFSSSLRTSYRALYCRYEVAVYAVSPRCIMGTSRNNRFIFLAAWVVLSGHFASNWIIQSKNDVQRRITATRWWVYIVEYRLWSSMQENDWWIHEGTADLCSEGCVFPVSIGLQTLPNVLWCPQSLQANVGIL